MRFETPPYDPDRLRNWTAKDLAEQFGPTLRWWKQHLPELVADGVLAARGRTKFGRGRDIENWLLSVKG